MRRIIAPLISVLAIAGIAVGNAGPTHAAAFGETLYGTDSGESFIANSIVTLDQNDGSITTLTPQPGLSFTGLAFDDAGRLFAIACTRSAPFLQCGFGSPAEQQLMELDPLTGAVLETIGIVTGPFPFTSIDRLSVQPGTDVLYGLGHAHFGSDFNGAQLWTIDKSTASATHISEVPAGCETPECSEGVGLAFAPDGTLYHHYWKGFFESALMTLDPSTGVELTSVPTGHIYVGLAVRSDGIIFATEAFRFPKPCRGCPPPDPPFLNFLYTIDPLTGSLIEVGRTIGAARDLDFSPVVELVDIDIKPGSDPSVVNPLSRGVVPVAIFGSGDFDVADIDVTSLTFGFGDALPASVSRRNRDVDADGFPDLLLHFRIAETGVEIGDTGACLSGETLDGTPFSGCDTIRTVPDR